ncbi:MAG: CbiX/SirB N-terminal domain-containing protein [Bacteroidota bacterium]|nr:CbiX/SirB N-terminal domain-containing protein [Bacteroidota bacterium]
MKKVAVLIVGHGSKSAAAVKDFEGIVECVRAKGEYETVLGAHMELASPSIQESVDALYAEQYREIIVVPYFLYEGNHIRFDIPEILQEIQKKYPDLIFKFARHIGVEPSMADILIRRAKEME